MRRLNQYARVAYPKPAQTANAGTWPAIQKSVFEILVELISGRWIGCD